MILWKVTLGELECNMLQIQRFQVAEYWNYCPAIHSGAHHTTPVKSRGRCSNSSREVKILSILLKKSFTSRIEFGFLFSEDPNSCQEAGLTQRCNNKNLLLAFRKKEKKKKKKSRTLGAKSAAM